MSRNNEYFECKFKAHSFETFHGNAYYFHNNNAPTYSCTFTQELKITLKNSRHGPASTVFGIGVAIREGAGA